MRHLIFPVLAVLALAASSTASAGGYARQSQNVIIGNVHRGGFVRAPRVVRRPVFVRQRPQFVQVQPRRRVGPLRRVVGAFRGAVRGLRGR